MLCLLGSAWFVSPSGAIKRKVELEWGTEDTEYLQKVHTHVEGALNEFRPDIVVYNAGTDILDGDPLGGLAISPQVCVILSSTASLGLQPGSCSLGLEGGTQHFLWHTQIHLLAFSPFSALFLPHSEYFCSSGACSSIIHLLSKIH